MTRCFRLGVLVVLVAVGTCPADEKKDPLQGKWTVKAITVGGTETMPDNAIPFTFGRGQITLGGSTDTFKYRLDTNASPALLDVTTPDGKEIEGIWEIKGDVLRICICTTEGVKFRPTEFHGRDNQTLLTLERVKE